MLFSVLVGCKGDKISEESAQKNVDTIIENGVSANSYQIVRPDNASEQIIQLSVALAEYIKAATGYAIPITTDFEKGNYTTRTDYEILIGETNRDESKSFGKLTYRDWAVTYTTTRIALYAKSEAALSEAVKYFEENCINADNKTLSIEKNLNQVYKHNYPVSSLSFCGNGIENYVIVASVITQEHESARRLQDAIANLTGCVPEIVFTVPSDKKAIVIGGMDEESIRRLSEIAFNEYLIEIDSSGTVYLGASGTIAENAYAVEKFISNILKYNVTNDTATVSGALELGAFVTEEAIMNETMNNVTVADSKYLDELDAKTAALKNKIINSKNTVNTSAWSGKVYYVSNYGNDDNNGTSPATAWKTLAKVNSMTYENGTAVLFARGNTWRGCLIAKSGVTYSSYGTGAKPQIFGSPENGAKESNWQLLAGTTNIWVYTKQLNDVGAIVFDEGSESEAFAYKVYGSYSGGKYLMYTGNGVINESTMKDVLKNDLYFFCATDAKKDGNGNPTISDISNTGKLYLRCDDGNPGKIFDSIEFCTYADPGVSTQTYGHIVNVPNNMNGNPITIDNLCLKFGGVHGIGGGDNKDLTVTNCEIGWIGGTVHAWNLSGSIYKPVALGNAVEVARNCVDFTVQNNWIYQCYDTGITNQTSNGNGLTKNQNIKYNENLIDYCDMSIEIWYGGMASAPTSADYGMKNVAVTNNICRFIGYGICQYRPNYAVGAAVSTAWGGKNKPNNKATNYIIENNTFFLTNGYCQTLWIIAGDEKWLPDLEGNTYIDIYGNRLGMYYTKTAEDLTVSYADHFSDYNYNTDISATIKDKFGDSTGSAVIVGSIADIKSRYKHMERDTWHQGVPKDNKY